MIRGTENTLKVQIWNQLPGSSEIDSFCSSPNPNLSAEMSIGKVLVWKATTTPKRQTNAVSYSA